MLKNTPKLRFLSQMWLKCIMHFRGTSSLLYVLTSICVFYFVTFFCYPDLLFLCFCFREKYIIWAPKDVTCHVIVCVCVFFFFFFCLQKFPAFQIVWSSGVCFFSWWYVWMAARVLCIIKFLCFNAVRQVVLKQFAYVFWIFLFKK